MPFGVASIQQVDAPLVQGSTSRRVLPEAAGGKPLPAAGMPEPEAAPKAPPPPRIDLSRAVETIERFMRESSRNLLISYDETSRRSIITVVDGETGEVVRQIPPAELLALARRMADNAMPASLFDARA